MNANDQMPPPDGGSAQRQEFVRRARWLDNLVSANSDPQALTPGIRRFLIHIDEVLFSVWDLGDNIILVWTRTAREYCFLAVRHYAIIEALDADATIEQSTGASAFINEILAGQKFVSPAEFDKICRVMGQASNVIREDIPGTDLPADDMVTGLVRRYGVSLVRKRAVVLLDAVGFSLHSPLEQVAMLNSLSYSVNSAHRQLQSKDVDINFARITTGDGFYIWNRAQTVDANIALYKLMMLILTDNAVARSKAKRFPVPRLRAAFHVGEHYEFYQVEALNPTTFGYIVGEVTIDLSRIIERALPGQILLGDFNIEMDDEVGSGVTRYSTMEFVDKTISTLDRLKGLKVAGEGVENIRCYLTGASAPGGKFVVNRYQLSDKHGFQRTVYNAKINIHLDQGQSIFLGIQNQDLHPTDKAKASWPEMNA